jgi:hypothetical protein
MKKVCEVCGAPVYEIQEHLDSFNCSSMVTIYCCTDEYDPLERWQTTYCGHKSYTYKEVEKDKNKDKE